MKVSNKLKKKTILLNQNKKFKNFQNYKLKWKEK